jgi:hypothetical protein
VPSRTNNKGVIPEKLLTSATNYHLSRFETTDRSSLVRIPPNRVDEMEKELNGPGGIRNLDPRHVKAVS